MRCVSTEYYPLLAIYARWVLYSGESYICNMNINARSAGPPSCFLLASRSPVSCNSEKTRFSEAPHAPASRRPRCRCRSHWPRASVPQLRSSRTLWPGLERRADTPPLKIMTTTMMIMMTTTMIIMIIMTTMMMLFWDLHTCSTRARWILVLWPPGLEGRLAHL